MENNEYYVQDSRQFVGNSMLFWANGESGYTTDIRKAHVFTKEEAYIKNAIRKTDIPWSKSYLDSKASLHVNMQNVNKKFKDVIINKED